MNWIAHPIANAAARWLGVTFAGQCGAADTDDARQEGAIKAWRLHAAGAEDGPPGRSAHVGRGVAVDLVRREGRYTRDGFLRPDRQGIQADDEPDTADPAPGPEQQAMIRQRIRRMSMMPREWQMVVTGIIEGQTVRQIGASLPHPVTPSRVSQMVRQIISWIEDGQAPFSAQLAQAPDTGAQPSAHAVDVIHALQAVKARRTLQQALDEATAYTREADAAHLARLLAIERESKAAAKMYAEATKQPKETHHV
jgi:hypothetical protein